MESYGEYRNRGDYHKSISKDWSYYPLYNSKRKSVLRTISGLKKDIAILDAGCGEGSFIEELRKIGFSRVVGLDENYGSDLVLRGSVQNLPFRDNAFDMVLFLDVIEHIPIERQEASIRELHRVLKDRGLLLVSVPNLAHLASRISFLAKGKLIRTASLEKHPGDRPIREIIKLFKGNRFILEERRGFFPTVPVFWRIIQRSPRRFLWLYEVLNRCFPFPGLCFLNLMEFRKTAG